MADRDDDLANPALVFQRAAREVYAREKRLKQQLSSLQIEIDQSKKQQEVALIMETDYFKSLRIRAKQLRAAHKSL